MEHNEMDKEFRALKDRKVEFESAHWELLHEKLQLEEDKRKRRLFWIWLLPFAGIGACALWYFSASNAKQLPASSINLSVTVAPLQDSSVYGYIKNVSTPDPVDPGMPTTQTPISNPDVDGQFAAQPGHTSFVPGAPEESGTPNGQQWVHTSTAPVSVDAVLSHAIEPHNSVSSGMRAHSGKGVEPAELGQIAPTLQGSSGNGRDLVAFDPLWMRLKMRMASQVPQSVLPQLLPHMRLVDSLPSSEWSQSLSVFTGPDFVKPWDMPSSPGFAALDSVRTSQENAAIVTRTGLHYTLTSNALSITTGIELVAVGENTNYHDRSVMESQLVDVSYWEVTENNYWEYDSVFVQGEWVNTDSVYIEAFDSTWVSEFETQISQVDYLLSQQNGRVRHRIFQVPIHFGYTFHIGSFDATVLQGVNLGYITSSRGHLIQPDLRGALAADDAALVRRKWYLSSATSVKIQYYLNDQLSLFVQPRLDLGLTSVYQHQAYQQRYASYSASFGLAMRLK